MAQVLLQDGPEQRLLHASAHRRHRSGVAELLASLHLCSAWWNDLRPRGLTTLTAVLRDGLGQTPPLTPRLRFSGHQRGAARRNPTRVTGSPHCQTPPESTHQCTYTRTSSHSAGLGVCSRDEANKFGQCIFASLIFLILFFPADM